MNNTKHKYFAKQSINFSMRDIIFIVIPIVFFIVGYIKISSVNRELQQAIEHNKTLDDKITALHNNLSRLADVTKGLTKTMGSFADSVEIIKDKLKR